MIERNQRVEGAVQDAWNTGVVSGDNPSTILLVALGMLAKAIDVALDEIVEQINEELNKNDE